MYIPSRHLIVSFLYTYDIHINGMPLLVWQRIILHTAVQQISLQRIADEGHAETDSSNMGERCQRLTCAELRIVLATVSEIQTRLITETYPTCGRVHTRSFGPASDVFAITTESRLHASCPSLAHQHQQQTSCSQHPWNLYHHFVFCWPTALKWCSALVSLCQRRPVQLDTACDDTELKLKYKRS